MSASASDMQGITLQDYNDLWAAVKKNSALIELLLSHSHLSPGQSTLEAVKQRRTSNSTAGEEVSDPANLKQKLSGNNANGKTTLGTKGTGGTQKATGNVQKVHNTAQKSSFKLNSRIASIIPKKRSNGDCQRISGDLNSNTSPAQLQSNGKEKDAVPARKRRRTKEESTTPRERRPTSVQKQPQTLNLDQDILQKIPRHHKVGAPTSLKASQSSGKSSVLNKPSISKSISTNSVKNNTAGTKKKNSIQLEGSTESTYPPLTEKQMKDLNTGDSIDLFDRRYKKWFPSTILSRKSDANGVASIKIHYVGWNKRYDRWVKIEADRIRLRSD